MQIDDHVLRAERGNLDQLRAAPEQRVGRLRLRQHRQIDAAPAARLGDSMQRPRVAARRAVHHVGRNRKRAPPRRAVVRQAVAEPNRFLRHAVVPHGTEVTCAVVDGRLQRAAQRAPVAVLHHEAFIRESDVGEARERHGDRSCALEVRIEQRKLAVELTASAGARGVPHDLHLTRQRTWRRLLRNGEVEREEGVAVALLGCDFDRACRSRLHDQRSVGQRGAFKRAPCDEAAARIALEKKAERIAADNLRSRRRARIAQRDIEAVDRLCICERQRQARRRRLDQP